MRAGSLFAIACLVGCAGADVANDLTDPSKGFQAFSGYASAQQVNGDMLGKRADPITGLDAPAAVPYRERLVDVGGQVDFFPAERSVLGTSLGLMAGVNMGYVTDATIENMPPPTNSVPIIMGLMFGSGLEVYRRPQLMISLHTAMKFGFQPHRVGETGESPFVVYAGARVYYDTEHMRTRFDYDFMPFWAGETRLEHRVSALLSTRPRDGWGYGVRAALALGQRRLTDGGLNDTSVTVGLEVQR